MKKLLKILGIIVLVLLVVGVSAAAFLHFRGIPTYDAPTVEDIKVDVTPERVAKGEKIAALMCVHCHTGSDNKMSGAKVKDIPELFGEVYSMNITNDPDAGLGKWTDGDLIYFLRTGVRKDGSYAPPYMPKFPLLSDEDLNSIVAWLRSDRPAVQASKEEPPKSTPSLFTKFLCNVVPAGKPFPYPKEPIVAPDSNNAVAYGKYLANNLYGCFACHSKSFPTNNDLEPEKSEGFYGGGNTMKNLKGEEVKTKNITPDAATGIGSWTEEQFVTALRTGKTPTGQFQYPMVPYTLLTDLEAKAIYAYLKTIPAINNKVQ